jgi:hypothetical protein
VDNHVDKAIRTLWITWGKLKLRESLCGPSCAYLRHSLGSTDRSNAAPGVPEVADTGDEGDGDGPKGVDSPRDCSLVALFVAALPGQPARGSRVPSPWHRHDSVTSGTTAAGI